MLAVESKVAAGTAPRLEPAGYWKHIVEPVEPFLEAVARRLAKQVNEFDPALAQYAEYALNGNGKHLRPTLVALAANSLGQTNDSHVTVAVIIEMVHLATLVHDDVMDEAEIRRGQLTLAANWGNEIAVLFGDCLFAQALKLAASFPTPEVCRAVATATNTVCSGEILQTQHRRNFELSRRDYFRVLEMKTAELFALSCDLAAFLSDATAPQRAALRRVRARLRHGVSDLRRLRGFVRHGAEGRQIAGHGPGQGQADVAGVARVGTRRRRRPGAARSDGAGLAARRFCERE